MKNAIIFHGGFSTPEMYWYPSIKQFLEQRGYDVWVPQLPDGDHTELHSWLDFALKNGTYTQDTTIIGHSLGSALIVSLLEHLTVPVDKAILVAGFTKTRTFKKNQKELMLQDTYNWDRIKKNVKDLIFINSSHDPWDCNDDQGLYMWRHLGGTLILRENEGHMGSEKAGQLYPRFYLLEKLLELTYSRQTIDGSDKI